MVDQMSMKIVERRADMERNKIAVILPGIGYHKDKPLLYYAATFADLAECAGENGGFFRNHLHKKHGESDSL